MFKVTRIAKKHNAFKITAELTAGKLLSIRHALEHYTQSCNSPVATDMLAEINAATFTNTEGKSQDILAI